MDIKISKKNYLLYFLLLPIFLLGIHIGMTLIHIYLMFSFEIPFLFRLTGIISAIWVILSIILYVKNG